MSNVRCNKCGGWFDTSEPKCPYCGAIYVPGAEAEYMDKLGDIREDMEDLEDLALSETGSEMKSALKKTFLTVLAVAGGIIALFLIAALVMFIRNVLIYM